MSGEPMRSGYVVIAGRPNVGKSTLMNRLLGEKLSIVSHKPQTTRHRILGVLSDTASQIVFVDTPGLHRDAARALNRSLNRAAKTAVADADLAVFVIEALRWTEEDDDVLQRLRQQEIPTFLAINKIDRTADKSALLPFIDDMRNRTGCEEIFPLSALKDDGVARLLDAIRTRLPVGPALFPADQLTDRSERFIAAEIIREKLTRALHQELPYGINVEIEAYQEDEKGVRINAVIWVERPGQKAIAIGHKGETMKAVGRAARLDLKKRLGRPVHLELWVKVLSNWADNERHLRRFGYDV
ncbi:MAG: GTPase Era [Chromatiales bacterium]|nr:GTPase Era [Chromatiales bacterium]MDH3893147.1 GTPase Era [Chromatiales bacterium]MDH3932150.1 GTPase Era [Chromatiales bacterium]MDH3946818.1 GTPase Era [Chromatiales bacterium]MDH4013549.1 GTPase Era [Chromatiales bacterium]